MCGEKDPSHPCGCCMSKSGDLDRREFMAGAAAGGLAMAALGSLAAPGAGLAELKPAPPVPLKVQPVLACRLFKRRKQTSWRSWGGIHTREDIAAEQQRIVGQDPI